MARSASAHKYVATANNYVVAQCAGSYMYMLYVPGGGYTYVGNSYIDSTSANYRVHVFISARRSTSLRVVDLHLAAPCCRIGRVTHSIDIVLSSTPPVVCTATSHANTEVRHFSLDPHEALPACHTRMH